MRPHMVDGPLSHVVPLSKLTHTRTVGSRLTVPDDESKAWPVRNTTTPTVAVFGAEPAGMVTGEPQSTKVAPALLAPVASVVAPDC